MKEYVSGRYANVPSDFEGIGLLIVDYSDTSSTYPMQILFSISMGLLWTRNGNSTTQSYNSWRRVGRIDTEELKRELQKQELCEVFHSIGVIGDSLASGQGRINDMNHYHDFYDYSWPQCMKRKLNNIIYNFTKSGLNTRTWLTDSMGYPLMSDGNHNVQCYIIGLGANDISLGDNYLGNPSDINVNDYTQNADTYYGNYARIISLCKVQEPRCKIFVLTNPSYGDAELRPLFNEAVRYMPTIFSNVYLVELDSDYFNSGFILENKVKSHYTPAAYKLFATYIEQKISDIIYTNPSDFYFVDLIGTEYSDPTT